MKLYWKIFLAAASVMLLVFAAFGSSMLYFSFQNGLDYEVGQCYADQRSYRLMMTAFRLDSLDRFFVRNDIAKMDERVRSQFTETDFMLLSQEGEPITSGKRGLQSLYGNLYLEMTESGREAGYTIDYIDQHYILAYLAKIYIGDETYYVGSSRQIDKLYRDREILYREYLILTGVLTVAGSVVLFLIARVFTGKIGHLRKMARRFAGGDYSARANIFSADEIGELSADMDRMADRLEGNIGELQDALRRQEDFTAAFSHELKTPMTAIVGYGEMIRSMKLTEEEIIDFSGYICDQGRRLEKLSRQMLELMRLTPEELQFERILMPMVIREAVGTMNYAMEEKRLTCMVQAEAGYVKGSRELLVMLVGNLLDNARKASNEGGRMAVLGRREGDLYRVIVIDEGVGIPEEELGKVTEAFYMVDKSRARKEGGSGLGLALCSRIVESHGGKMDIRSHPGHGTRVSVTLPLIKVHEGEKK